MKYSFSTKELFEKIKDDNTNYKLIILVIASVSESYNLFVECWKEYMNIFPEVKAYFLYSDPTLESDVMIYDNLILYKGNETLVPGIFQKTLCAMNFCQKHFSYDYIIRTNLSTFLHIPRLLDYLSDKPKENFFAGHYNQLPDINTQALKQTLVNTYLEKIVNEKFIYMHGTGIILSKDIVGKLIHEYKNNYQSIQTVFELPDDVLISLIMYKILTFDDDIENKPYYHPKEFVNTYKYKIECSARIEPKVFDNNKIFLVRNKILGDVNKADIDTRYADLMNYIHQIRYFYNMPSFMDYIDEPPKKKVIDCFTFNNNLDMLEYRLNLLNDTVDRFILVETTKTNTGIDKSLYYADNKDRFSKFNDKIIHIVPDVDSEQEMNSGIDSIFTGIAKLGLEDYDYIVISDIDEIPDPLTIQTYKENTTIVPFSNLKQEYYYTNLNHMNNELWMLPKIITYQEFVKHGSLPSKIRSSFAPVTVEKGGWYLSRFGDSSASLKDKANITKIPIKYNTYLPPKCEEFLSKYIEQSVEYIDESEKISYELSEIEINGDAMQEEVPPVQEEVPPVQEIKDVIPPVIITPIQAPKKTIPLLRRRMW